MTDQKFYDIAEREIVVGSWIAQAYSLGRCPALKIAQVQAITDKGKLRCIGYERYVQTHQGGLLLPEPRTTWTRNTTAYALAFPERMCVIDQIPPSLEKELECRKSAGLEV